MCDEYKLERGLAVTVAANGYIVAMREVKTGQYIQFVYTSWQETMAAIATYFDEKIVIQ